MNERAFLIISDNPDISSAKSLLSKLKDPLLQNVEYIDCSNLKGKTGLARHILGVNRIEEYMGDISLKKLVTEGRSFLFFNFEKDPNVTTTVIRLAVSLHNSDDKVHGSVTLLTTSKLIRKQMHSTLTRFRLIENLEGSDRIIAKVIF